jgi:hypothetical protein
MLGERVVHGSIIPELVIKTSILVIHHHWACGGNEGEGRRHTIPNIKMDNQQLTGGHPRDVLAGAHALKQHAGSFRIPRAKPASNE